MSYLNTLTTNASSKTSSVCFTLPITCQICLGKVKEPVVCPNLHAFCSFCIDIWLEKSKQCPTCRVPISKENPCRKILGGYDPNEVDKSLVPTDFSHPGTRKARFTTLMQDYENEISRLNRQIDSLQQENQKLKDNHTSPNKYGTSNSPQQDMVQMLKTKLQSAQSQMDDLQRENDRLKDENKKIDSENSLLMQDVQRLKANLSEKNSQFTSRYSLAALESKLETCEKEIKQLQRALDKSDKYIIELESQLHANGSTGGGANGTSGGTKTYSFTNDEFKVPKPIENENLKFIKGDMTTFKNELKVVKFADQTTRIPDNNSKVTNDPSGSPLKISNNKFYGSPIKTQKSSTTPQVSSFTDRLKKNLSFDLEVPSPLNQSLAANASNTTVFNNDESKSSNSQTNNGTGGSGGESYLFSPMKRLRLEEFQLEKPEININESTTMLNDTTMMNVSMTPEFNDCLQLLNEAETKIQNRSSPFVSSKSTRQPQFTSKSQSLNHYNSFHTNSAVDLTSNANHNSLLPEKYFKPTSTVLNSNLSSDFSKRFTSTDQLSLKTSASMNKYDGQVSPSKNDNSIDNLGPYMPATNGTTRGRSPLSTDKL